MIYLISDLHESTNFKALNDYLSEDHSNDLLIILGDIGLKFRDTEENEKFTQYFLSIKYPVAFIDGNHENYQYIYSYPVEEWNGGLVHRQDHRLKHVSGLDCTPQIHQLVEELHVCSYRGKGAPE